MELLTSNRFEVTLNGTHGIVVPENEAMAFIKAGHSRVMIKAFFESNEITLHGALHFYNDNYIISFGKRYQKELGTKPSDYFEIQFIEDTTKYGVEIPEEFSAVLQSDPEAFQFFEKLSDGKKRTLIYHIIRIKNSQTRIDKAILISENLKMGITDQKELLKSHF